MKKPGSHNGNTLLFFFALQVACRKTIKLLPAALHPQFFNQHCKRLAGLK
jgi:hypothetical protein